MVVQRDVWLNRLTRTLASRSIPLDPPNILARLEQMLTSLEHELGENLENGCAAGLLLHLLFSCLSQRQDAIQVKTQAREYLEQRFPRELALCIHAINTINQDFPVPLPTDEAYNLLGIFKHIDIFINIGELFLT
jgi:transcriptional regulatory protein LevR